MTTAVDSPEFAEPDYDEFLRTDHLQHDLKGRFVSGGVVTVSAQGAKFLLTLISTVVLARLLGADDFGVMAMVTGVISFMRIFKDAGLSTATVQRESITYAQVSNLFWINVGASGVAAAAAAALAPAIAWFYNDQRLLPVTLVLSLTFIFSGAMVQPLALLNRQMRFKAIASVEIISLLFSVLVGVILAAVGCHYWSLVASALAVEVAGLGLSWSAIRWWIPQLPRRGTGTRALVGFGANLTFANLIFSVVRGLDYVFIGRRYGSESVGFYSRATALLVRPLDQIMSPISAVILPTLSRLQSQPERYRRSFQQINEGIILFTFPITAVLLGLAHPLIIVLLGRKWEQVAPIFAGFTPAALQAPLSMAVLALYTSQGRGRELLIANTILSPLTFLAIVVGLQFGPIGIAISLSVSGLLLRLPIHYFIAGRRGPVRTKDLWLSFIRCTPLWALTFAATWIARRAVTALPDVYQLIICASAGLLVATAGVLVIPRWRGAAINLFQTIAHTLLKR